MGIGVQKNYAHGVEDASKHVVRLERACQEGIVEMTLDPHGKGKRKTKS